MHFRSATNQNESVSGSLDRALRLQLIQFVCSFAWADLEVRDEERAFVANLVDRLALDPDERRQVQGWLERPPPPEAVDPMAIPASHRKLFLEAIEGVIAADGEIATEESEALALLQDLFS